MSVKRTATINNFGNGGLNLTDLDTSIKSLRLAWIAKLSTAEPSPWKSYLRYLLKPFGEFFFLHCNYNINDYDIESVLFRNVTVVVRIPLNNCYGRCILQVNNLE